VHGSDPRVFAESLGPSHSDGAILAGKGGSVCSSRDCIDRSQTGCEALKRLLAGEEPSAESNGFEFYAAYALVVPSPERRRVRMMRESA